MTETIPINSKIKLHMHPDSIKGVSLGAASARNAMGILYLSQGKIIALHEVVKGRALLHQRQAMAAMPAPAKGKRKVAPALAYDQNAADHVIDAGKPLAQKALAAADVAIETITSQVKNLDAVIDSKITAGKNPVRGPELRAWAARQDSPFIALGPLFQDAGVNKTLVAEVLLGEHFLSGITPDNKAVLRQVAAGVLAGPEVEDRNQASVALGQLTNAAKEFVSATAEVFNSLASPVAGVIDSIVGDDQ